MSTENDVPQTEERINIDLTKIDQPFLFVPEGTFHITLVEINQKKSKEAQRPMLECIWETPDPETGEPVRIRDYLMLDSQGGKFRLRQIIYMKGLPENDWTVPQLVGAAGDAELELQDDPTFGKQNRIRRLLQAVPKAVRM